MEKTKGRKGARMPEETAAPAVSFIPENEHPDFVAGRFSDAEDMGTSEFTPNPDGPTPGPLPGPLPFPDPLPFPIPVPEPRLPRPFPLPGPLIPLPAFCSAVSGRYRLPPVIPSLPTGPILPFNLLSMTVRVDVDRFFPQNRISIEMSRRIPNSRAHVIAEVTSDSCSGYNRRTIVANITYRDGNAALIPGTTVTFRARRTTGFGYGSYELTLSGGGITPKTYNLNFESIYFDNIEFEVDSVDNAGTVVTSYDTHAHPNRPASMPSETLSLATIYQRAGFNATMSSGSGVIPVSGAGANGTWSDTEMHNAMVTYWSRFANNPAWAMWVLYAARHDMGRSLGGIMFDDIGPNHRQGTAIFTDSFIQDAPAGDANPAAWRNRMQFWTAIHEMGHGFNLAHSWQKALGTPWIPLGNEPEACSFMNYPYNVSGGQAQFFSNFNFRFSDDELVFMRHAPRRFVQMGNSNWFDNHGFEAPDELAATGNWKLAIRPNRDENAYRFLEPVAMELKLTNTSGGSAAIEEDMLADGRHVAIFVQREGGELRQLRPMITRCHKPHLDRIDAGRAIYGTHMISTSTEGWLIDEPGFYKVQAAVDLGTEIVVSNVLRLYVAPPVSVEEGKIAGDYFTEDVGRVLAFAGAPQLAQAEDVLRRIVKTCADNPAVVHAAMALSDPMLQDFKVLAGSESGNGMKIVARPAKVDEATKIQIAALMKEPDKAADTVGHITFFGHLQHLADSIKADGNEKGAQDVMSKTISLMKARKILPSVIADAERQIKRRS
jgi:hypothetical protein